jgi:hypothetical protein
VWRLGGVGCSHLLGVCYYCFQFSSKWGILWVDNGVIHYILTS